MRRDYLRHFVPDTGTGKAIFFTRRRFFRNMFFVTVAALGHTGMRYVSDERFQNSASFFSWRNHCVDVLWPFES